jgi:hypothetical protein
MPGLAKDVKYEVSEAAAIGTLVHQIAEMYLKNLMDGCSLEDYWLDKEEVVESFKIKIDQNLIDCAKDFIQSRQKDLKGKLLVEEKLYLDEISDNCYGTADAVIIGKNRLVVCDFKTGKFPVEVKKNKQLMIYGLGALARYGNESTTLELTIVQPRSFHPDGPIRSWDISATDLVSWGYESLQKATEACEEKKPDLNVGDHCRFCNARSICPKLNKLTGGLYGRE